MAQIARIDADPLLLMAEVLSVNTKLLREDLNSAKYTFLSFSEKTRNEVKNKSLLLQDLDRHLPVFLKMKERLGAAEGRLADEELALVRTARPALVVGTGTAESDGGASGEHVVALTEEDMARIRDAEERLKVEEEKYRVIAQAVGTLEDRAEEAREASLAMTTHVQALKSKYDSVRLSLAQATRQKRELQVLIDEFRDRAEVTQQEDMAFEELFRTYIAEEASLLSTEVVKLEGAIATTKEENKLRRESHEIEIAAYVVALKEQKGLAEELKYKTSGLRRQFQELEELSKRQEIVEADRHSVRSAIRAAFFTPKSTELEEPLITPEHVAEMDEQKMEVFEAAARIAWMCDQRNEVIRQLRIQRAEDETAAEHIVKTAARIRAILSETLPEHIVVTGEEVEDSPASSLRGV